MQRGRSARPFCAAGTTRQRAAVEVYLRLARPPNLPLPWGRSRLLLCCRTALGLPGEGAAAPFTRGDATFRDRHCCRAPSPPY